jgi:hypothetical protein
MSTENTPTPRMDVTYKAFISMQPISAENVTKHIQLILNEGTKIETELATANAHVLALREALERCKDDRGERDKVFIHATQALSAPPPPVVAKEVYDAAEKDAEDLAKLLRDFLCNYEFGDSCDQRMRKALAAHEARKPKPVTLATHFGYKPEDFAKYTEENAHKLP